MLKKGKNILKSILFQNKIKNQTIEELQERLDWFIAHSEITALKPATGYLRKKQLDLIGFVESFFSEIRHLDLHPFLIGGNLIGAYRHNGFVPWDDDLDFGLIRSEYNALIDFCKKNYHVVIYEGKWSNYNTDVHLRRMNDLVTRFPNEYVLDIWVDQIQIMKGTSCIDRIAIDFWSFDYYADDYSIESHKEYLEELSQKKKSIDYVDKIVDFIQKEIENNKNISKNPTDIVFPGIDSVVSYLRVNRTKEWLKKEHLFPLKYSTYEYTKFYTPNNVEEWLRYEYPDYMSYPPNAGCTPHEGYKERFIMNSMPYVEFYLVDAFEIFHFLPLYNYFEKNGIYAYFIAERPKDDNSWFDYTEAVDILEYNGVRYKNTPNYKADCVFTTQRGYLVRKYKGKKIHLCYGVGLTSYSFSESKQSIDRFDLKLVHGDVSYNIVREKAPHLKMIKAGYLRYTIWGSAKNKYSSDERIQKIISGNVNNKPILLYFPTWDEASSIDAYAEEIKKLKSRFYIITKAHHCTYRLGSEEKHRGILEDISDVVLEGNFSFEEAVKLGDIAICDAVSGSATEVPFLKRDMKMLLLYSPIKEKNQYKGFIDKYACIVRDTKEFVKAVERIFCHDAYIETRKEIIDSLYYPKADKALDEIKGYIIENSKKKGVRVENAYKRREY